MKNPITSQNDGHARYGTVAIILVVLAGIQLLDVRAGRAETTAPKPHSHHAASSSNHKTNSHLGRERPDKIYATPVTTDQISDTSGQMGIKLVLNNKKDRVGAEFSNCKLTNPDEDSTLCQGLTFVFSQMHMESTSTERRIFMGNEVVATVGSGDVIALSPGYDLGYEVTPRFVDTGFDEYDQFGVRVFLKSENAVNRFDVDVKPARKTSKARTDHSY